MSMRYPGGLIASTPVTAAYPSGVWTQAQTIPYASQNVWMRDQYWPYTTLLLQGNGTNGAQNNTFLDSSTNNFTITRNGNTTQGSFTPYEANGYWSNYFNGSTDYLTIPNNTAFLFGSGAFTIECWVYSQRAAGASCLLMNIWDGLSNSPQAWAFNINTSGKLNFTVNTGVSGPNVTIFISSATIPNNAWTHLAVSRSGNTWYLFINGALDSTATNSSTIYAGTSPLYIGSYQNKAASDTPLNGYISNARIVKGTAVYTAAFTPPAAPLTAITNTSLLTCQSNRFLDNSTNAFAITVNGSPSVQAFQPFPGATTYSTSVLGGSGYFDGSGDWLTLADNAAFDFGSGNFTAEAWIYPTAAGSNAGIVQKRSSNANYSPFLISFNSSTVVFAVSTTGSSWQVLGSSSAVALNTWHHVALVRNGTAITGYVDGVSAVTGTVSGAVMTNAVGVPIGSDQTGAGGNFFTGYIMDVRLLKGTAQYTSNFTPPTAPLTAITNTSLLLNFTNAGIFDAATMNDLETVGNAQVSTSVVKYGTGSMAFDGSGDRLYEPSNQNFNFGTGDFTIELWVNPINQGGHGSSNNDCLIDFRPGSNGVYGTLYIYNNGTGIYWFVNSANRITGGAISNNTWTHIALCRASGSTRLFLNGTQSGSTYTDSNNYLVAPIMIGEFNDGVGGGNLNGYIDDLRITKGAARYTSTFTPPIARMPQQ